jgi:hypothetical protein
LYPLNLSGCGALLALVFSLYSFVLFNKAYLSQKEKRKSPWM